MKKILYYIIILATLYSSCRGKNVIWRANRLFYNEYENTYYRDGTIELIETDSSYKPLDTIRDGGHKFLLIERAK